IARRGGIKHINAKSFTGVVNKEIRPGAVIVGKKVLAVDKLFAELIGQIVINDSFGGVRPFIDSPGPIRAVLAGSKVMIIAKPQFFANLYKTSKTAFNRPG